MGVFVLPYDLLAPGVTGLGRLGEIYFQLPVAMTVGVLNIALLLLGLVVLGWRFAASIVLGSLSFPVFLGVFEALPQLSGLVEDPLYAALCAGAIEGVGLGLIIRAGGSSGGSDVVPIILNRKFKLPIAPVLYGIDTAVIALQLPEANLEAVVLSALYAALYTVVMNYVLTLGTGSAQVFIFSERYEEINSRLLALDHGTTLLCGETGYFRRDCRLIVCVAHLRYLNEVKRVVMSVDPEAFMTVGSVRDVSGRGFTLRAEHLSKE